MLEKKRHCRTLSGEERVLYTPKAHVLIILGGLVAGRGLCLWQGLEPGRLCATLSPPP